MMFWAVTRTGIWASWLEILGAGWDDVVLAFSCVLLVFGNTLGVSQTYRLEAIAIADTQRLTLYVRFSEPAKTMLRNHFIARLNVAQSQGCVTSRPNYVHRCNLLFL
jgi:hypothetical protein